MLSQGGRNGMLVQLASFSINMTVTDMLTNEQY